MPGIPIGASGFIRGAEWTRKRLQAFGVALPPGNRLAQAERLIRDVNDGKQVLRAEDEAILLRVTEAQWTILEQYIVARSLGRPGRTLPAVHLAKLHLMLSGAATEDED